MCIGGGKGEGGLWVSKLIILNNSVGPRTNSSAHEYI